MPVVPSIDDILADDNLTTSKKMLLIVLARHAHSDGTGCYPSLRRLSRLSALSLAHVCTLLQELETTGYISIERFKGPKGVNAYILHKRAAPVSGAPVSGAPVSGARSTGAPVSGTEVQAEERKDPEVLFQPEEHQPVVLQSVEQSMTPTVSPAAASWLRINGSPGGIASQACGLDTTPAASTLEPRAAETTPPTPRKRREPALYFQGKLCPRRHDDGTGHTLRRVRNGNCTECDVERTRAKRQAAAAAKAPAPKASRRVIDLAAHRQAQGG